MTPSPNRIRECEFVSLHTPSPFSPSEHCQSIKSFDHPHQPDHTKQTETDTLNTINLHQFERKPEMEATKKSEVIHRTTVQTNNVMSRYILVFRGGGGGLFQTKKSREICVQFVQTNKTSKYPCD